MGVITFNTYKIAYRINLDMIIRFFNLKNTVSWKEYVVLDGFNLESVLKYNSGDRKVYIFKFGCITFVDFNPNEIYAFLEFLQSIIGNIDYTMYSRHNESHLINVYDDGYLSLWGNDEERVLKNGNVDYIISVILAKSTELNLIKEELSKLLDESESFITYLQNGKLRANVKKVTATMSKIIKFKYTGIESVKVLERPAEIERDTALRYYYDRLSEYYELEDRYGVIEKQIGSLQLITEEYFKLGKNQSERKLVGFEVFLLMLFPAFHILEHIFGF